MSGLLASLPAPLPGRSGWPWNVETDPATYSHRSQWPRISIVTPSFNQGAFVEETIRSVLLQNYPDLQYIVIDGGSTDGTVNILEKYSPWIDYWVSERDRGQSHAINKGLARCDGEWFNWINSDDCLLPGGLAAVGQASQTSLILCAGEVIGGDLHSSRPAGRTKVGPTLEETIVNHYICQQGLFVRTDTVRAVGGVREDLHYVMDLDLLTRLLLRHGLGAVAEVPDEVAFYRWHDQAKGSTVPDRFIEEERGVFQEMGRALGLSPQLLQRVGGSVPAAACMPDLSRLDPSRLSRLLARKFWWNGPVERAWRLRDFSMFKREVRYFLQAFPDENVPRVAKLRRISRVPIIFLRMLSLFRAR
jgi:glycosyltransferase involved in cell wall biosynthesis